MTPRSSCPGGEYSPLRGANLRLNYEFNTVAENCAGGELADTTFPGQPQARSWLSYGPGSFLASRPGSFLPRAEDAILERATNVLSVIHPHVYFPTYSNGLKDIGRFLEFERADKDAMGLQSIVWRKSWNENPAPDIKTRLLQYNQDDCRELRHIAD